MTDQASKDKSIAYILAQGLVKPPSPTARIANMVDTLGLRFIFWDFNYSLIFSTITTLGILFLYRYVPANFQYSAALGLSPIMFLVIVLFAEINARMCNLYELKQTCRYTSRHITALRCICYSVAGVLFAVGVTALSTQDIPQFFRILPISLGGLFLFATMELSVIRFARNPWGIRWGLGAISTLWVVTSTALPLMFQQRWEGFLSALPLPLTIIFAALWALAFLYQTNKILMEENHYVIA